MITATATNRRSIIVRADVLLRDRQYAEAERALTPLVYADPADAEAHLHIAAALLRQGSRAACALALGRAADLAHESARMRLQCGRGLSAIGEHDRARAHFAAWSSGSTRACRRRALGA
jgi:Flp pilus assembly protein TadD